MHIHSASVRKRRGSTRYISIDRAKVNSQRRPHVSVTERAELAIAREEARDIEQARIVRREAAEKKLLLHQSLTDYVCRAAGPASRQRKYCIALF
jgi:hypothetical protein